VKTRNSDSWCSQLELPDGRVISGGPAREARIAARGGMDRISSDYEMRGYRTCTEEVVDRVSAVEKRVARLEKRD
jgi:hypothetical protein